MKRFLTALMVLVLIFQPVLRAEEKAAKDAAVTEAAGKALKTVSGTEESGEDLKLDDLSLAGDLGLEESLEEDEFGQEEKAGTIDLEDKK